MIDERGIETSNVMKGRTPIGRERTLCLEPNKPPLRSFYVPDT